MEQLDLFSFPSYKISKDKTIRLIELFAGVGSQAMALRNIGANFEHYRVCEFDKYAIASYNAIHHTTFEVSDITQINGDWLGITDKDKYEYIMTYSFPCTDLSIAGQMKGMKKGSGTRSGLLWEVERLLNETKELPQILLMENVPQVHSEQNIADFNDWINFLKKKGYQSAWKDLNAKDYGVAQNRERCFIISVLSKDYVEYNFPAPQKLTKCVRDYLQENVEEKYFISKEKSDSLIEPLIKQGVLPTHNRTEQNRTEQNRTEQWLRSDAEKSTVDSGLSNDWGGRCSKDLQGNCTDTSSKRLQRTTLCSAIDLIPAKLDKPSVDGKFKSLDDAGICDLNTPTASTLTSRYYKGIANHKDNLVIVKRVKE